MSFMVISSGCLAHSKAPSDSKTTPTAAKAEDTEKEEEKKDPRSYFTFDKNGKVKTKSGKAEKTFNFPDIKVGFVFLAPQMDILPILSLELFEFKKIPIYFDIGIAPHLAYLSVGYNIIPIYEVGIFIWGGYNFIDRDKEFFGVNFHGVCFGVGLTVIKF